MSQGAEVAAIIRKVMQRDHLAAIEPGYATQCVADSEGITLTEAWGRVQGARAAGLLQVRDFDGFTMLKPIEARTIVCHEGVTRAGNFEPCDRPAVAHRYDPETGEPYPVCTKHTRRDMVTLQEPA